MEEDFTEFLSNSPSSVEVSPSELSSDSEMSFISTADSTKAYHIQGKILALPKEIEQVDLTEALTVNVWTDLIDEQDKETLLKLLPKNNINETLEDIFTSQIFQMKNPIASFSQKLKHGVFEKTHSKQLYMRKALWDDLLYQYTTFLALSLPEQVRTLDYDQAKSNWVNRRFPLLTFESDDSSDESAVSANFDGCSSGNSTLIDDEEEALYENNDTIRKPEEIEKEAELKHAGNLDWVKYSARFKDLTVHKDQLTIQLPSNAAVENFRKQETERYKNPLSPWPYQLEGHTCIVAPVCKKLPLPPLRPKDNQFLKTGRPPYISLAFIVKDAVARLLDGVGTRVDVSLLVRFSQYLQENISDRELNSIVSSTLDQLQYEKDPCVHYDSERKLWVYLYRGRGLDFAAWKTEMLSKRGRPPVANEINTRDYLPPYLVSEDGPRKKKLK